MVLHRQSEVARVRGSCRTRRRGVILVVVLIVAALLTLAAYTFTSLMIAYRNAAQVSNRQLQAQALVESGAESVRFYLMQDRATRIDGGGHYDNPMYFQAIPVMLGNTAMDRGNFTVLVPGIDDEGNLGGNRYGLENESTRLNLNALLLLNGTSETAGRDLLMGLPGMTEDVADAILDWLDEDDEPREYGVESDYYMGLDPPYSAKNGPLDSIDELLLVAGVTPSLLYGSDTNRNGMLDPHELSGSSLLAPGQEGTTTTVDTTLTGGSMDRGWSGYLTLYSREKNVNSEGLPRIDLNGDDLETLYASLAERLNEDWARFIIAYRQNGAYDGSEAGENIATVGDLDMSKEGATKLTQVLDLVGKKVQIPGSGDGEATVVAPVFAEDLISMAVYMPVLMDNVTVNGDTTIPGRVNINEAPRPILEGIPGLDEDMVAQIISQRYTGTDQADSGAEHNHETWILLAGIVTLDEMKQLMPFVTAGGDVFRAQVVGYFEDGGASARAEVVFDATGAVCRIVSWNEMSHLGRGYPLDVLGVQYTGESGGLMP